MSQVFFNGMVCTRFCLEEIEQASEAMLGFCIACGSESAYAVEPDARNCECEECGESTVFGADEILIMGLVE